MTSYIASCLLAIMDFIVSTVVGFLVFVGCLTAFVDVLGGRECGQAWEGYDYAISSVIMVGSFALARWSSEKVSDWLAE